MSLIPSCPEICKNLTEYQEHSLPIRKRFGIWIHLMLCHGCNALRKALLALPSLSKRLMEAPAEAPTEAKDAFALAMTKIKGCPKPELQAPPKEEAMGYLPNPVLPPPTGRHYPGAK